MMADRLFFLDAERGMPSLPRGWHKPGPSPTQTASNLPGCGPKVLYAASFQNFDGDGESLNQALAMYTRPRRAVSRKKVSTGAHDFLNDGFGHVKEDAPTGEASTTAQYLSVEGSLGYFARSETKLGDRDCTSVEHKMHSPESLVSNRASAHMGSTAGGSVAARLVFCEAERGIPALSRGWRTPDPSPSRDAADLPGCRPLSPRLQVLPLQGDDPSDASHPLLCNLAAAESQEATSTGISGGSDIFEQHDVACFTNIYTDSVMSMAAAFTANSRSFLNSELDELCTPCDPLNPGSVGHPHTCAEFCKYHKKSRGCKEGATCDFCHLCTTRRNPEAAAKKKRPYRHRPWRRSSRIADR